MLPTQVAAPLLHGGNNYANYISRAADIPLAVGAIASVLAKPAPFSLVNLLSPFFNPIPAILGGGAAMLFANKKIIIVPGQPTTASFFAKPYVKAASVAAAFMILPYSSTVSAFSFGFLFCCRLQRSMPEKTIKST